VPSPERRTPGRFSAVVRAWWTRIEAEGAERKRRWFDDLPVSIAGGGLVAIIFARDPAAWTARSVPLPSAWLAGALGAASGALACLAAKRLAWRPPLAGALAAAALPLLAAWMAWIASTWPSPPRPPRQPFSSAIAAFNAQRGNPPPDPSQYYVVDAAVYEAEMARYHDAFEAWADARRASQAGERAAIERAQMAEGAAWLGLLALPGLLVPLARRLGWGVALIGAASGLAFALAPTFLFALFRAPGLVAGSAIVWLAILGWTNRVAGGPRRQAAPPRPRALPATEPRA
jgi:hypothetical protein